MSEPVVPSVKTSFVKKSAGVKRGKLCNFGILRLALDLVLLSDLGDNYCFPLVIASTGLRPDFVLYSKKSKLVIMIELTSPCEENFLYWNQNKQRRCGALSSTCPANGWKTFFICGRSWCPRIPCKQFDEYCPEVWLFLETG